MSGHPILPSEPINLPLLPLRDVVVFPHMVIPLFVGRPKSIKALDVAMDSGKHILLVAQKSAAKDDPGAEDLYPIGCVATVLQMLKLATNVREERFVRVEKLRSSSSIPGLHAFSITSDGIEVYPRLLTPKVAPAYTARTERVNTGIKGLDRMIHEGFWRGSTTLVAGPPGSGKTIMALQFIGEGALKDNHAGQDDVGAIRGQADDLFSTEPLSRGYAAPCAFQVCSS